MFLAARFPVGRLLMAGVGLALSLAWLVRVAPVASSVIRAQTVQRAPSDEDGERLFRAILFLDGPDVEQVPELRRMRTAQAFRSLTPRQREAINGFQNGVVAEIRASSPDFLPTFGACMRGGDRRAIARCLTDASAMVDRVIVRSPQLTKSRLSIRAAWERSSADAGNTHTGVQRAISIEWPPLTYQWPNVLIKIASADGGDLLRDNLVNSIASRLRGPR